MIASNRQKDAPSIRFEQPLEARLLSCDGAVICECSVLDLSESAARLKIAAPVAHPAEFFLLLSTFGRPVYRRCLRDWSEGALMGVTILNGRRSLRPVAKVAREEKHIP
jgi:hypothetical protein